MLVEAGRGRESFLLKFSRDANQRVVFCNRGRYLLEETTPDPLMLEPSQPYVEAARPPKLAGEPR